MRNAFLFITVVVVLYCCRLQSDRLSYILNSYHYENNVQLYLWRLMKPAPFRYYAPQSLDEVLALLTEYGYDAKLLAGGQSLIPAMNFRLAQPTILIDLNNVSELTYIALNDTQEICLGTMTRQRAVEQSTLIQQHAPLLHTTMPLIAHTQIRNRGTIGGTLAHADPAAELPAVAVVSDAQFKIQSQAGTRWIGARDFYVALFTTDLAPDEVLNPRGCPPSWRLCTGGCHSIGHIG